MWEKMGGSTQEERYKKGLNGEKEVAENYRKKGYSVIYVGGATKHSIDGGKFFSGDILVFKMGVTHWIQVKDKPPRKIYPDTGFEKWRYENYKWLQKESGLRIMLVFRNTQNELVGNFLDELEIYGDHGNTHNSFDNCEMVYFWSKDLLKL